jgi:hypothetical protein
MSASDGWEARVLELLENKLGKELDDELRSQMLRGSR